MFLQYLTPREQKVWSLNTPVITAGPAQPGRSAALILFQGNLIVNLIAAPMVVIIPEYVFIVLPTKTWQGLISSLIESDFIRGLMFCFFHRAIRDTGQFAQRPTPS